MRKRIVGFDLLKCIAIFSVVVYHFGCVDFGRYSPYDGYTPNITKIFYELFACSVPLFFIVNGALTNSFKGMKTIKYLSLSLFYPIFFYLLIFPALDFIPANQYSLRYILFSMEFKGVYWFLFTIGILYIVDALANYFKLTKVLFIILLICPFVSNLIWTVLIYVNPNIILPFWGHWGVYTLFSFVYFCIGRYLKDYDCHNIFKFLLCILGWWLLVFEVISFSNYFKNVYDGVNSSFPTMGALLLSTGIYLWLKGNTNMPPSLNIYISFIGRNTMGIYVFHMFFVYGYRYLFSTNNINVFIALLLSFCIVNITAVISELICKTKFKFFLK